jgi:N,N'-diacetyllegionaminate synthase
VKDVTVSDGLLVIAEAGVNHNGRLDEAIALVRAAKQSGADVVKFQHFRAENVVAGEAATAGYQKANTGTAKQYDLLKALELDLKDFATIAEVCRSEGIQFLCTPFEIDAATDLVAMGMRYMKVPSGELTNTPFLKHSAGFGLPVLLSTGMGTMDEVACAVSTLERAGARDITVLQCTSLYPAPPDALNLRAMVAMAERFGRPVGFSDHSLDDHAAVAAVALGATVIEKHFTLDCAAAGPDHRASLEPDDFARMVHRLRETALALGDGIKRPNAAEQDTAKLVRRSWHAARSLQAGQILGEDDIVLKRPLGGLPPDQSPIGRKLRRSLPADGVIQADDIRSDG